MRYDRIRACFASWHLVGPVQRIQREALEQWWSDRMDGLWPAAHPLGWAQSRTSVEYVPVFYPRNAGFDI
jgi:hypothetical protein